MKKKILIITGTVLGAILAFFLAIVISRGVSMKKIKTELYLTKDARAFQKNYTKEETGGSFGYTILSVEDGRIHDLKHVYVYRKGLFTYNWVQCNTYTAIAEEDMSYSIYSWKIQDTYYYNLFPVNTVTGMVFGVPVTTYDTSKLVEIDGEIWFTMEIDGEVQQMTDNNILKTSINLGSGTHHLTINGSKVTLEIPV